MRLIKKSALLAACFTLFFTPLVIAKSAEKIWSFKTEGQIWSSIKIKEKTAYFGSDDGDFYAVDTAQETLRWKYKTGGKIRSTASFSAGNVYFSSDDGLLYAVNKNTGKLVWTFALNDGEVTRTLPANHAPWLFDYGKSSPVIDGNMLYIGSADQHLYAINAKSGQLVWKFKTGNRIRSTPAFNKQSVFIASWDGKTYAIDKQTGEMQWKRNSAVIMVSDPKVLGDKLIIGSRDAYLYALDVKTGNVEWKYYYAGGSWVDSAAVAGETEDVFYIGSSDAKRLSKFNVETGKEIWQFTTGGWSWGTPVLKDGVVYVGAAGADDYWTEVKRGFFAVDAMTGKLRWQYQPQKVEGGYVHGGVHGSVAIDDGKVYIPNINGSLDVLTEL